MIQNDFRGVYVEHMVAALLGDGWKMVGGSWSGWDLTRVDDGIRVEVKQSAATQTWTNSKGSNRKPTPRFSIPTPKGRWDGGTTWIPSDERHADIYVFAWHPVCGDTADHRDPHQWVFFAARTDALPDQKTISLQKLETLAVSVRHDQLSEAVNALCKTVPPRMSSNILLQPEGTKGDDE